MGEKKMIYYTITLQLTSLVCMYISFVKTQFQPNGVIGFDRGQAESQTVMQPMKYYPKYVPWGWMTPFDPAKFTNEVKTCHRGCGDIYFDCAFLECDEVENTLQIDSVENEPTRERSRPSIWTRFLRILSFGLLGNEVTNWPEDFEIGEKMKKRNSFKCFQTCRRSFRACYKDCICRRVAQNDTLSLAMCFGVAEPVTTSASVLSTVIFRPKEISAEQYRYTFNWNKIQ